jgi:TRAP-type C4-dicarboxylate transport system permease large subunit
VAGLGLGEVALMLALIPFYLVLGMFLSPLVILLVTVPILMPVVDSAGVSPFVFGVFVVLLCEIAIVTPPNGILLYIIHRIVQEDEVRVGHEIGLKDVIMGVVLSLPLSIVLLVLVIFFHVIV